MKKIKEYSPSQQARIQALKDISKETFNYANFFSYTKNKPILSFKQQLVRI